LKDQETLHLGSLAITSHFTPGHTPGGTSWTWQSCENNRCVSVVYSDSMTSVSSDDFRYSDDPAAVQGFRKSFAFLRTTSCDILLTAHPEFSGLWTRLERRDRGDANAMIDAKSCKVLADRSEDQLRQRLASEQESSQPAPTKPTLSGSQR
jgi:metallo-beta-lactamase class B